MFTFLWNECSSSPEYANYEGLKSVISRYIKRPHDVEDIVQETFVKSYQAQKRTSIDNIKAYLFTTARNLSFKYQALHANKITDYLEDLGLSEVVNETGQLEDEIQAHQQFGIFCEAVRELPGKVDLTGLADGIRCIPSEGVVRYGLTFSAAFE